MLMRQSLARRGSSQVKVDLHFRIERIDPAMTLLEFDGTGCAEEPDRAVKESHRASLSDRNLLPSAARSTAPLIDGHESYTAEHDECENTQRKIEDIEEAPAGPVDEPAHHPERDRPLHGLDLGRCVR
jgi:hypothetical protein